MYIYCVLSNLASTKVTSWRKRHNKPGGRRSPPSTKLVGLELKKPVTEGVTPLPREQPLLPGGRPLEEEEVANVADVAILRQDEGPKRGFQRLQTTV